MHVAQNQTFSILWNVTNIMMLFKIQFHSFHKLFKIINEINHFHYRTADIICFFNEYCINEMKTKTFYNYYYLSLLFINNELCPMVSQTETKLCLFSGEIQFYSSVISYYKFIVSDVKIWKSWKNGLAYETTKL